MARFIVVKAVREYLRGRGKRTGRSLLLALDAQVQAALDKAVHNSGPFQTVKAEDAEAGR
jgi:hypothetical protein